MPLRDVASDGEHLVLAAREGDVTLVAVTSDLTGWQTFEVPPPSGDGLPHGVKARPFWKGLAIGPEGWLLHREVRLGVDPWVIAPADIRESARHIHLRDPDYVGGEPVVGESLGLEIDWDTEQHEPGDPYFSRFVTWEELGIDEDTYRHYGIAHFANKPYTPTELISGEAWVAEWGKEPIRVTLPRVSGGTWETVVGTDAGYFARAYWGEPGYPQTVGPEYFSPDGSTWVTRDTPIASGYPLGADMAVVPDGILIGGRLLDPSWGTISESQLWLGDATGSNWRLIELPEHLEGSWFELRTTEGGVVVVGGPSGDDAGSDPPAEWMMVSRDAVDWQVVEDPTVANLWRFVMNGNVTMARDPEGNLWRFVGP